MARVRFVAFGMHSTLNVEFVIVQATRVRSNTVVVPHIHRAQHFLTGDQGFVEFFAMTGTNDLFLRLTKDLHHAISKISDSGCVRFLDEQIAGFGMFKCECHKVNRFIEVHQEASHVRIGDGNWGFSLNLVDKERDDRATGTHDIAIPGTSKNCPTPLKRLLRPRLDDLLPNRLGHAHRVDRIGRLVGGKEHNPLHSSFNRSSNHIVCTDNVGANRLHREELAGGNFLKRSSMEHIIRSVHDITDRIQVTDITDVELNLGTVFRIPSLEQMPHPVLLFFIPAENADLADISR